MKNKIIFPIIFSILFFTACDEDFFETTVPVDIPEHTPALAITSHITAGDSIIGVYVSNSVSILDDIEYEPIKDATVELFKDGQNFATIPYFEFGFENKFYILELDESFPFEESDYELKISAPGFESISAKQTMPEKVEIISVEYDPEGAIDSEGERVDEFSVEFQDPAGVENFYQISIYQIYEGGTYSRLWLDNLDPTADTTDDEAFLKDSSFDGKKYTWRMGSYNFSDPLIKGYLIELYSVTKDKYLFSRSSYLSQNADDNPFAEPVIVHGNVENGNGVFSMGNRSIFILDL